MRVKDLHWPRGQKLLDLIRKDTDTVMLAFSRGKDAIAAWLVLREHGFKIHPMFMYGIPGLGFVERSLCYYEDFFQTRIIRVPHPSLYRKLNNMIWQPPEHFDIIQEAMLPRITYDDLRVSVAEDLGLPENQWIATGVRAADSPQRMMAVQRLGPIRKSTCTFWPVWDMNKATLIDLLKKHRVKLPEEYRFFGRTWDGLDVRFLWGIKKHYPLDYKKILTWFPLAELEILRYESFQRHKVQSTGPKRRGAAGGSQQ
jgi:hypothetical protein